MHPQIVEDHAGNCPICGMELVEIVADATSHPEPAARTDSAGSPGREVKVDPAVLRKIGVRTVAVAAGTVGREIRADAEGVLDQAAEVSVMVRTMGYLESVAPVREGDRVKAGQILASLFSPELTAAQGDWLAARRNGDSLATRAARDRLATLGFPASGFATAERAGAPLHSVPVSAPVSGWVKGRTAVRGQATMAGAELFRLVEGEGVVLEAHLPVAEAAALRTGDVAALSGDGLEGPVSARVVSQRPEVERTTRSATVRLAPGKGARIRPGGLYLATFQARRTAGLVVPQDAVLHSGRRDIVFLALGGGRFEPVEVRCGPTSGGRTLVLDGVSAGDEVVVSAQFLLDGESRLQAALEGMTAGNSTGSVKPGGDRR
jgi:Cu(I)/Ag(I) efflux system membrane fusion protein